MKSIGLEFHAVAVAAVMLLISGSATYAQSNGVPGLQDYSKFTQFITDRNIFDPNRQPHYSGSGHYTPHIRRHSAPPGIQFVGTMSYEKGLFAFFSGNSSDLSKVARVGDQVAGYTVTEISASNVVLESTDKKQISLGLGSGLRQDSGKWVSADSADLPTATDTTAATETPGSLDTGTGPSAPAAPSSASEPNDVLKRLMEKREKENQ